VDLVQRLNHDQELYVGQVEGLHHNQDNVLVLDVRYHVPCDDGGLTMEVLDIPGDTDEDQ